MLANNNNAVIGDVILAPGRADGGKSPQDQCGKLFKYIPIDTTNQSVNEIDAALSTIFPNEVVQGNFVNGIPGLPANSYVKSNIAAVIPGDNVHKLGRTTKGTSGVVQATNVHIPIGIKINGRRLSIPFADQISISSRTGRFSAGGDSGSAILNDQAEVVALLFAGSKFGGAYQTGTTFANPINKVFAALNISL